MRNFLKPTRITWIVFWSLIFLNITPFIALMLGILDITDVFLDSKIFEPIFFILLSLIFGSYELLWKFGFGVDAGGADAFYNPTAFGWIVVIANILILLFVYYFIGATVSHIIKKRQSSQS